MGFYQKQSWIDHFLEFIPVDILFPIYMKAMWSTGDEKDKVKQPPKFDPRKAHAGKRNAR